MPREILVAYATTQESTRAIASAVADNLREFGAPVTLEPMDSVGRVDQFRAVVLGTAIHDVVWLPGLGEFMSAHRRDLETMPVWVFASGPAEQVVRNELDDPPTSLINSIERVAPRDIALFAGALQPHHVTACLRVLSRITRTTLRDHGDEAAIHRWTDRILRLVEAEEPVDPISVMTIPYR